MTVEGSCNNTGLELDKRTYLPGIVFKSSCPSCKREAEKDMEHSYLSYPIVGKPCTVYWCCHGCEKEWQTQVRLSLAVDAA